MESPQAQQLYQQHAADCPLIDFHTHLSPRVFVENQPFQDFSALWVSSDPYKWRAMRMHGIPERLITGNSTGWEKFSAWAHTLPYLAGNPLYDWARLELERFFGIDEQLSPKNAPHIWDQANERLSQPGFLPQSLLQSANVECLVTSDAWLDTLDYHQQAKADCLKPRLLPSLRADDAFAFESPAYLKWLNRLGQATGIGIHSLGTFLEALLKRLDVFDTSGCVLSDHGLDIPAYAACTEAEAESIFKQILNSAACSASEYRQISTFLLLWLAGEYTRRGWTMQLHMGARRETSSSLAGKVGKQGGYAVMRASIDDDAVVALLDAMESGAGLPRTILYPLNTLDYEWVASLSGSFVGEGMPAKVQLGPAWWYNDHYDGIERQLRAISSYGMLAHSVGMNTDSRSFLSSVRHEYFRRILCNLIAQWIKVGRVNASDMYSGGLIEAVCYRNARDMLGLLTQTIS